MNSTSAEKTYTVSGSGLLGNVSIIAPAGFQISITSGSGFGTTLSLAPNASGTLSATTIYIRFSPTGLNIYTANITHSSTNAPTQYVAVSGTSFITTTACNSYTWNGVTYTTSGDKTYTTTVSGGADSIATLRLTIKNSSASTTNANACNSYTWNGTTYTTSGNKTYTTTNAVGCDSTATLQLTIKNSSTSNTTVTACNTYSWNGTTYTTSGNKTYLMVNAAGCDSTATLQLTIKNSSTSNTTVTACNSYSWNGTTYTTSGNKTYSTTNAAGCDSTATLQLTIKNSSTSTATVIACNSYTWNGTSYTTSGNKTFITTNAAGCDSTATLQLTIRNSSSSTTTITACNSYTWNGTTYTTSGNKTFTTTNAAGCDSAATLHLTIACSSIASLKVYIQGYYNADAHTMRRVLANQGIGSGSSKADSVMVKLHHATNYSLVATTMAVLQTDGTVSAIFPPVTGNYFVAVKNRSAVETWSTAAMAFTAGGTTSYDFTTADNKAYADNMTEVEPGVWAMYSGDINQDGNVDGADYSLWETDYNDFASGYYPTDLNGDGNVDGADYSIWEANYNNFISTQHPQ